VFVLDRVPIAPLWWGERIPIVTEVCVASGSLPCSGLLFLLVTIPSPRTGPARDSCESGRTLGSEGVCPACRGCRTILYRAERAVITQRAVKPALEVKIMITLPIPRIVQSICNEWPGGTSAIRTMTTALSTDCLRWCERKGECLFGCLCCPRVKPWVGKLCTSSLQVSYHRTHATSHPQESAMLRYPHSAYEYIWYSVKIRDSGNPISSIL
jgi:hypothetical protein